MCSLSMHTRNWEPVLAQPRSIEHLVMLLLAHLEAVPREALNGLAVPFVFWNLLDLLQCLAALQQPLQGLNSSSTAARQRREQHAG
ncbi:hypothetical protein RJT34_31376 [Clitoria ternatea]|uniref:Uncharacterized protein n=1 Tax=Clitoria ternatea TaxID=43366 RepID=A0AAN9EVD9_CLITE